MPSSKVYILASLFLVFLLIPIQVNGDANNLDRTKVGVKVGEIYIAKVEKFDTRPDIYDDDSEEIKIPEPGDIFVSFEIIDINVPTGVIKLNVTFTEDYFGENPEPSSIEEFSLEEIDDGLFVYTDWEYWKENLTKSIEQAQNEFGDQSSVKIIDTSSEFGFISIYEEESDWYFGETTKNVQTSEYIFDKSTGAIKRVSEAETYTFQNGTKLTYTTEFSISKNSDDAFGLSLPGFELYISIVIISILTFTRKKIRNQ